MTDQQKPNPGEDIPDPDPTRDPRPVEEPDDPDLLPDEEPVPNPDETDDPPIHAEADDEGAPGTTDQRARWEGPPETRPPGYLPAKDDPNVDRNAAGENLQDPERSDFVEAFKDKETLRREQKGKPHPRDVAESPEPNPDARKPIVDSDG